MRVRRHGWPLPSLLVATVTLVVVTAAVLADAPPRPANPAPSALATDAPVSTPSEAPGRWVVQNGGTSAFLADVSCADSSHCIAVGSAGTIVRTSDGGSNWTVASSGTTHSLDGVSCPSPSVCYAVDNDGEVFRTGDGGVTWSRSVMKNRSLFDISCPTALDCYTADGSETHDGGGSWQQVRPFGAVSIECPASTVCYAIRNVGTHGVIVSRRAGGWVLQTVTPRFLDAVRCTSVNTCVAVGGGAQGTNIAATRDGRTWMVQRLTASSGTLLDVGCLRVDACVVVNATGNVIATADQGKTWTWQTTGLLVRLYAITCPSSSSCFAVGTPPAGGGALIVHYDASTRP